MIEITPERQQQVVQEFLEQHPEYPFGDQDAGAALTRLTGEMVNAGFPYSKDLLGYAYWKLRENGIVGEREIPPEPEPAVSSRPELAGMIEVESAELYGTKTQRFTPEQLISNVVAIHDKDGKATLDKWIEDHNTTFTEIAGMIHSDKDGKPVDALNIPEPLHKRLFEIASEYKKPAPSNIAERAAAGNDRSTSTIEMMAAQADSLSDKQLESLLRQAGMLRHNTNLGIR